MTLTQGLTAIIIFWAIIGGLGASLLLPSMQSLIHGNFTGDAQRRVYALVGAAAAIAAAVGPLLGGFITTFLSWRVAFGLEVVIIAVVLSGMKAVKDVPYTGSRAVDAGGAILSVLGMGGIVLGILVWQEGGEYVAGLIVIGGVCMTSLFVWLRRRKTQGKPTLLDPGLFESAGFRIGVSQQMLQQIALGGTMIALPIYLQMVLEYNAMEAGLSLAPLSLTMFATAILAGKKAAGHRPAGIVRVGFALVMAGLVLLLPIVPRADSGWWLAIPLVIAGCGLGLLVSQLNNYTLSPIDRGTGQRGSRGQLRGRVLRALVRPRLRRGADARGARGELHRHVRRQRRVLARGEGTGGRRARGGRPGDEQHPARGAPRRSARGRPGRDPRDQHRRAAPVPPGGAAGADPRRRPGADQRVPDDAAARPSRIRPPRGPHPGVSRGLDLVPLVAPRSAAACGRPGR